ncbi:hypothetical protein CPC08DRAFT_595866, partial [Agrocybe pediades]
QPQSYDLPTAFYTLLGSTLFFFGCLLDAHPHLAMPGEPARGMPYWLAALDVFEIGENLPVRTRGVLPGYVKGEDWRMAIMWGRTLVCVAEEVVRREREARKKREAEDPDEPVWPPNSPFAAIAARRPPLRARVSLKDGGEAASPHALLVLAQDQFSRGILHMPHPLSSARTEGAWIRSSKELYTIAYEVLLLSEKLESAAERQTWAGYADSVFSQMK